MYRRTFLKETFGMAATLALPVPLRDHGSANARASYGDLPTLEIALTDTGFEIPDTIAAGRYEIAVANTGTITDSHWAMGKIPDEVTEKEIEEFFAAQDDTDALGFEDIGFVGAADWPQPDSPPVTGVVDLHPGRYFAFDPFSSREAFRFMVEGDFPDVEEPMSDLTVDLHDMVITLPEAAFTSNPVRWKIENTGSTHHDVAILPVPEEFTGEHLTTLLTLPEGATPPPDVPAFEYQPVAAIGILVPGRASWLDVELLPGHYLAVCMLPFGTGYPHAMDGMYVLFDVA